MTQTPIALRSRVQRTSHTKVCQVPKMTTLVMICILATMRMKERYPFLYGMMQHKVANDPYWKRPLVEIAKESGLL